MIAVDTNLLVYAHRRESRYHGAAASIMRGLAEGNDVWAIPWPCCYEFLSVVTNRRIWKENATSQEQSWRQLTAWTSSPSVRLIGETEDFTQILERFVLRPRVIGGVVHDARIAAICVAHGVDALLTRDRDFSLFPELRTSNPIPDTHHQQPRP
ncbi:MAG: PIN domain-containing protein [Chloroflexi bacterium]|nr:PIN domain-containing protein [Chloroflexota bacterium]MYF79720.1 PIN domain-containing protein [Chloroflexota bacterium]MYK61583.1 PIN domain-containing protein [Chloroflexota bacterium]